MRSELDEDQRLRSAALQNAHAVLSARLRAEHELVEAKEALERRTEELADEKEHLERRVRERTVELEAALRAKEEFLSRASHELRTPMNHVLGFAQLLTLDELTAGQAESVQEILTSGQHLLGLIDRILAITKSAPEELGFLEDSRAKRVPAVCQTL